MTPGIDPDFNRLAALDLDPSGNRQSAAMPRPAPVYLVGGAIRDGLADFRGR